MVPSLKLISSIKDTMDGELQIGNLPVVLGESVHFRPISHGTYPSTLNPHILNDAYKLRRNENTKQIKIRRNKESEKIKR